MTWSSRGLMGKSLSLSSFFAVLLTALAMTTSGFLLLFSASGDNSISSGAANKFLAFRLMALRRCSVESSTSN